MKKHLLIATIFFLHTVLFNQSTAQGTWTQKANFGGVPRSYTPIGFSIGTKGYAGTGYAGSTYYNDFWEWDSNNNTWSQKTNFSNPRRYATSFVINDKGYVALGNFVSTNYADLWEYDTTLNTWAQKAAFPGIGRVLAISFTINGKAYVGSGGFGPSSLTFYSDFYEYDPVLNTWTPKANFPAMGRIGAVGFSLNGKGYLGLGYRNTYQNDFWEYDPILDTWTQKSNFPATARIAANSFVIGNYAYVGGGYNGSADQQDFWQWEPVADIWIQKANIGGGIRTQMISFSINGKGYFGLGRNNGFSSNTFWEYDPNSTTGIDQYKNQKSITIFPNPFSTQSVLQSENSLHNATLTVHNCFGQTVTQIKNISGQTITFTRDNLPSGLYFVQLTEENKTIAVDKFVITDQ